MTKTQTSVIDLLKAIETMCITSKDDAEMFWLELNTMLDELVSQDAFGTEGQLDPRGDQRGIINVDF